MAICIHVGFLKKWKRSLHYGGALRPLDSISMWLTSWVDGYIFKIDGTNICPGLNYEELGATFNQALVFSTYAEGGEAGLIPPCCSDHILLLKLLFLVVVVCKIPECEEFITKPALCFIIHHYTMVRLLSIIIYPLRCCVCDGGSDTHDLTISLSILFKLCTTLLPIFCLFFWKRADKKENGQSEGRGGGCGGGGGLLIEQTRCTRECTT